MRDLPDGLAAFLSSHPRRISGFGGVTPVTRAGRNGNQIDGQFSPYDYAGCLTETNKCVPLFQLSPAPGVTKAWPLTGSEVAHFEIFDVVTGAKLVVVMSAGEEDFKGFMDSAASLLTIEKFEFTERIATVLLTSAKNPSNDGEEIKLTAELPAACKTGRISFTNLLSSRDRVAMGSRDVVDGVATVSAKFIDKGLLGRIVAEYEGADCERGMSAPLFQRVR